MSMNFSEFKKLLGADPKIREPETRRARESGNQFEQAIAEAESFERKLEAALNIPVDSEALISDILSTPAGNENELTKQSDTVRVEIRRTGNSRGSAG